MTKFTNMTKTKVDFGKIEILYILSICLCFQSALNGLGEINYYLRYIITSIWIGYSAFYISRKKLGVIEDSLKTILLLFFIPIILVTLYTILLYLFGVAEFLYFGRTLSCLIAYASPILMAFIGYFLFKDNFFKIVLCGFFASFFIVILFAIINDGVIKSVNDWIGSAFVNSRNYKNPFEVHDITFASGLVLLYYMFFKRKSKINRSILLMTCIIILLGFKRIQMLSLLAIVLLFIIGKYIYREVGKKKFIKFTLAFSIFIVVFLLIYVWLIDSGNLTRICEYFNINTMDRIHFYNWLAEYFDFSPTFLGRGFGVVSKFMQMNNSYGINFGTSSIHSEILRLFFELGFLGFTLLCLYYLVIFPYKILQASTFRAFSVYIVLQYYLFILHITDNTFTYYCTQYIFTSITIICFINGISKKRHIDNNYEKGDNMKKETVGIITLVGNDNYGNRLQNYALVASIKKVSECAITTIWYNPWKKTYKDFLKGDIFTLFLGICKFKRRINFASFTNYYTFPSKKVYYEQDNLSSLNNEYDLFVIGSDQIWNHEFRGGNFGYFEFARFADSKKVISYAASFGVSHIEKKETEYIDGLNHLNEISVRENAGIEIVKELTSRNATLVLDPTMLLTRGEWLAVSKKPQKMTKNKYLVTYFLGSISSVQRQKIESIANQRNLEIININDYSQKNYFTCGPSEFVYLFSNSSIVFTDSFHACVFSIIFEKEFYVFNRVSEGVGSMNSRINTLLKIFNLEGREVNNECDFETSCITYEFIRDKLEIERNKSLSFLAANCSNDKAKNFYE